ncbi:LacI family DNA-binding transcriptional regulator [Fimbriimonas ginsengisoli]|uniref:Transcriptional regulator, LacI family n=1 Tax=Fimbriimonas ginsengisoli Gsoil 348 TaxID=661478 RepID=A0A068NPB6_FIMGI|nr:LacI family DNA-binding transcriptional regulator [Fimbriimonas ginsengisoli]AIE84555.1 transcriptional regulator, LacI family [Fimbriimonas ginsengisoli Gsoil 348]
MASPHNPAATIRDVAAAVGVSPMAVSKVLHGRGENVRVGAETAERIRAAARELKYQPNHLARSLRSRRTQTIGLVFEHFDRVGDENAYFLHLLNGVMSATFPADYTLAICPKLLKVSEQGAIADGRFDGVLWCKPNFTTHTVEGLRDSAVPVVMMHAPPNSVPGVPTYCADNGDALQQGVEHLAKLGHRRIGFIVDQINSLTMEGRERGLAFLSASAELGLEAEILVREIADAPPEGFTGVITFSDYNAGQLLAACDARGVRVPEDLSIIGFDSTPFCERTRPKLTAISQPVQQMARDATVHLLALINGASPPSPPPYKCGFDVRESTGPPP